MGSTNAVIDAGTEGGPGSPVRSGPGDADGVDETPQLQRPADLAGLRRPAAPVDGAPVRCTFGRAGGSDGRRLDRARGLDEQRQPRVGLRAAADGGAGEVEGETGPVDAGVGAGRQYRRRRSAVAVVPIRGFGRRVRRRRVGAAAVPARPGGRCRAGGGGRGRSREPGRAGGRRPEPALDVAGQRDDVVADAAVLPPVVAEERVLRSRFAAAAGRAGPAGDGGLVTEGGAGQQLRPRLDGDAAPADQLVHGGLQRVHDVAHARCAAAEHEHVDRNLLHGLEGQPAPLQLVEAAAERAAGRAPSGPHAPVVGLHAEEADVERAAAHVRRPQPLAEGAEKGQWAGNVTGRHQVRDEGGGLRAACTKVAQHAFHRLVELGRPPVEDAALDLRPRAQAPQLVAHPHPPDGRVGAAEYPRHVLCGVLGDELEHREVVVAARRQVAGHGRRDVEMNLHPVRVARRAARPRRRLVPDRRRRRRHRQARLLVDSARVVRTRAGVGAGRAAVARGGGDGQQGRQQDDQDSW